MSLLSDLRYTYTAVPPCLTITLWTRKVSKCFKSVSFCIVSLSQFHHTYKNYTNLSTFTKIILSILNSQLCFVHLMAYHHDFYLFCLCLLVFHLLSWSCIPSQIKLRYYHSNFVSIPIISSLNKWLWFGTHCTTVYLTWSDWDLIYSSLFHCPSFYSTYFHVFCCSFGSSSDLFVSPPVLSNILFVSLYISIHYHLLFLDFSNLLFLFLYSCSYFWWV